MHHHNDQRHCLTFNEVEIIKEPMFFGVIIAHGG